MQSASEDTSSGADPGAPTDAVLTRTRRRTMWLRGKKGRLPLGPWAVGGLVALPLLGGLVLGGTTWAVHHIEDTLETDTRNDLRAAGIDTAGLDIDFDYRDGEIGGNLPAGVSVQDLENAVGHGLLHDIKVTAAAQNTVDPAPTTDGPTTSGVPTTSAASTTTVAVAATQTGPTQVDAEMAGGRIVLTGSVLTESQRDALVAAAAAAVGATNVEDQLTVSGLDEAVPGADARIADLAIMFPTLATLTSGQAVLTDSTLTVTGEARDQDSAEALRAAVAAVGSVSGSADLSVSAPSVETEVSGLQAELDGLAAEIRETVVFAPSSAELSGPAQVTLDKVVDAMNRYRLPVMTIAGHTDGAGPAAENQTLSEARAASVLQYLVSKGVEASRLRSVGFGETQPVAPNESLEGRAANRRVQLTAQPSF